MALPTRGTARAARGAALRKPPVRETAAFAAQAACTGIVFVTFNTVDADGSGTIEPGELLAELERRGLAVSAAEVESLFSLYANADGVLKVMEFAELAANLKREEC